MFLRITKRHPVQHKAGTAKVAELGYHLLSRPVVGSGTSHLHYPVGLLTGILLLDCLESVTLLIHDVSSVKHKKGHFLALQWTSMIVHVNNQAVS